MGEIADAVKILRAGGLVALPTETVYGLGGDATNAQAVEKIFAAKGRPATNPLIVHVADESMARRYASDWPDHAVALSRRFWPGPLTLVVKKAAIIPDVVTAGRPTIGLRAPDHPLALELLGEFEGPIAAPSANRSNRVSPTTADHVRQELGDAVDLILDGGPCRVGIESTVLDLSGLTPTILRPGGISQGQIERVIGKVGLFRGLVEKHTSAASPGQQEIHYAPHHPAFRFTTEQAPTLRDRLAQFPPGRVALIWLGDLDVPEKAFQRVWRMPSSAEQYAQALYSVLREADACGAQEIWVQMPPDEPQWAAVRDRLSRGTKPLL